MLGKINANMITQMVKEAAGKVEEPPMAQVVLMGVGTVFVGLICIVILCKIIGAFRNAGKKTSEEDRASVVNAAPAATAAPAVIENRQEIIAAVSAVAAEELGTDVSAIRIISFKKI